MVSKTVMTEARTIPFSEFWAWLTEHSGCIVRVGTASVVLVDHDDHHWQFAEEEEESDKNCHPL